MDFCSFTDTADSLFFILGDVNKRFMLWYLVIGAIGFLVMFTFKAIALYTIAAREGYKNKWMAFVPFLNTYYIGVVSDKNKVVGLKPATVGIVAASLEFVYVALYCVYFTAQFLIFDGGYATPISELMVMGGRETQYYMGYNLAQLPQSLEWAGWVYAYFDVFIYVTDMLSVISSIFLLMAFFQTYASRHYIAFALLSSIFPISGIFMFVSRNNRGQNYVQYLKDRQYRQYQQYQEYMRMNNNYNNYNQNANPYNGQSFYGTPDNHSEGANNSNGGYQNGESGRPHEPKDPFEDF